MIFGFLYESKLQNVRCQYHHQYRVLLQQSKEFQICLYVANISRSHSTHIERQHIQMHLSFIIPVTLCLGRRLDEVPPDAPRWFGERRRTPQTLTPFIFLYTERSGVVEVPQSRDTILAEGDNNWASTSSQRGSLQR